MNDKALIPYEYLCPQCKAAVDFIRWGVPRYLIKCSSCLWFAVSCDLFDIVPDFEDYA